MLNEKVRDLIKKSDIVSFAPWQNHYSDAVIQVFQAADSQKCYLSDADLQALQAIASIDGLAIAKYFPLVQSLRDRATEIVDLARSEVLQTFPQITEEGGGLYPSERANACWRDFWHFLRCITYGIAGRRADYLSVEGLKHMNLLYQELQVPLDAMLVGLASIKSASFAVVIDAQVEPCDRQELASYFDCLIDFPKKSFSRLPDQSVDC